MRGMEQRMRAKEQIFVCALALFFIQKWKEYITMSEKISENSYDGIRVTVHIPLNVSEDKKQRKINQIYDILTEHNGGDEDKNAAPEKTA